LSENQHQPDDDQAELEPADGTDEFTITNEFTSVVLRKIRTRNGERLEIRSLRVPDRVTLDALVLESLTWRPFEELAKGLEKPFGSEAHSHQEEEI
jgi:hypothetical protein